MVFLRGSSARSLASILYRKKVRADAFIGLRIATLLPPRLQKLTKRPDAMGQSTSVARRAAKVLLEDEIAHLHDLDLKALRARWRSMLRRTPPPHLPRHLLFAVLAYRLQADELGDIAPDTVRLLKQIGSRDAGMDAVRLTTEFDRRRAEIKPGTILTREWNGRPHRVLVVDVGFAWNGKIYDSLSKIASSITGTKWNGPRFFGLRDKISAEVKP